MINFRFHLVSLVAVFLALALGIVMGSTVIDRAIVDGLKNRIDAVEARADARRKENLELERRIGALETYAEQSVPHLVSQRLDGVAVTLVAVRGIDEDVLRATVETVREGGATVPGVLWIEPAFALPDPGAQARLMEAVGGAVQTGEGARQVAIDALGRRLADGPGTPASAGPTVTGAPDVLAALGVAGFVSFDGLGGPDVDLSAYPPAGATVLVVDGSGGRVPTPVASLPLVRAAALADGTVVFGEVYRPVESGPPRGEFVRSVR